MKTTTTIALLAAALLGISQSHAAITIPGANGTDGALNITEDTIIDLSQAITAAWDADNTANAGKGVYDAAKWAVVFKYSSVTVAAGKTVTFKNHPSWAPVVWLVSGNVTIDGTVSLDGAISPIAPGLAEPGPGGFRGGTGNYTAGVSASAGFGVGGGGIPGNYNSGYGGSYGSLGNSGPLTYGNPSLVPLLGGSGGGGNNNPGYYQPNGGSGGGGAILIACANTLAIGGQVHANGGAAASPYNWDGSGSGGGVRLVADTLSGPGTVSAISGSGASYGGLGRIRIERVNNSSTATVTPDPSVVPLAPNDTALLWPPSGAPQVKIVSIGAQNIPADPRASFGTFGADAVLPQTASTDVLIETTNVEQASQVKVRGTPRSNGDYTEVDATLTTVVSTTPLVVRWTATLPVNIGYSAVQVKVIRP